MAYLGSAKQNIAGKKFGPKSQSIADLCPDQLTFIQTSFCALCLDQVVHTTYFLFMQHLLCFEIVNKNISRLQSRMRLQTGKLSWIKQVQSHKDLGSTQIIKDSKNVSINISDFPYLYLLPVLRRKRNRVLNQQKFIQCCSFT